MPLLPGEHSRVPLWVHDSLYNVQRDGHHGVSSYGSGPFDSGREPEPRILT
jgi:hypothetical protein